MASLTDFRSVTHFLEFYNDTPYVAGSRHGIHDDELVDAMMNVGLISDHTPLDIMIPEEGFGSASDRAAWSPAPGYPHWDEVADFMRTSASNTFAVSYQFYKDGKYLAHAVVGVRKEDGTIAFLDFQAVPPEFLDLKTENIWRVTVIPTDVDWRSNRQLYRLIKNNPEPPPP